MQLVIQTCTSGQVFQHDDPSTSPVKPDSPHALHCGRPSSSRLQSGVVLVPQFLQLIPMGTAPLAGLTSGNVVIPA